MDTNRLAYFFGINEPKGMLPLEGCREDAARMNERFKQRTGNAHPYECHLKTDEPQSGLATSVTADNLRAATESLFNPINRLEVALLYFAGHGAMGGVTGNRHGFYLMTSDAERPEHGVAMSYILDAANRAVHTQERVIILDCCHAGQMGDLPSDIDGITWLKEGVSILAATRKEQAAVEYGAQGGLFTQFVIEALDGGSADVLGRITLASIYSYIDLRLSLIQQRPVFKANVSRLVSLQSCQARIEETKLRQGLGIFSTASAHFPLDHTYDPDIPAAERTAPVDENHVQLFRVLQKMRATGLLEPCGEEHLYWAAHHNKPCRLTALGQLYWHALRIGKP
jgi:hypothetical protein